MKRFLYNKNFIGACIALLSFVVYCTTLAPTVTFIDSGELAAVSCTLGIAHPTGYPLFTLLGWVFAHLPFGLRTIVRLNLMAALFCSLAIFFFFHLLALILSDSGPARVGRANPREEIRSSLKERLFSPINVGAAVGALALAFSETFWSQAVSLEVYSLHTLFLAVVTLLFLKAIRDNEPAEGPRGPTGSSLLWYSFAFALGLSFTNHMTTILLAPGFLYLFFATHGFSRSAWKRIFAAIFPFLAGLSVYLYLPLRASQNPVMNWGNPATAEKLWWHFSGKQYRVWIFSSFESAEKQLNYFLRSFLPEFSYVPFLLALIGLVILWRVRGRMFRFTLILFVSCVVYSINYDIHDIDSYFLLAYFVTAIWIAAGARRVLEHAERVKSYNIGVFGCLAIALLPLYGHYESNDQSRNFAVEDYTKNMFDSVDKNALVLSYQWDYFVSASYYYQLVEGVRSDVAVVDKELLRRSWYFIQLEHRYPWLTENSRKEIDSFLAELSKFEHDLPYNAAVIQARYEEMIHSFLMKSAQSRPVYVTPEIEPEFVRGFQKIPSGLAFRLSSDTTVKALASKRFTFRPLRNNDTYCDMIGLMYARSYMNQGVYLGMAGDQPGANSLLEQALAIKPDFREAQLWLQRFSVKR